MIRKNNHTHNCIVVLGPTASGKTQLACNLAYVINGEIISADSRQVYKHLNIGTGKDLHEYTMNGQQIPYHIIDVVEPNEQYYLHQFIAELKNSFLSISEKNKIPIICGGTGLYLDALRKDFSFTQIKENALLRKEIENYSKEELLDRLNTFPLQYRQHIDTHSKKRIIRGIEILESKRQEIVDNKKETAFTTQIYKPLYVGVLLSIEERKQKISTRLQKRLQSGLIEEVESLLLRGIEHERLQRFGLEYKFISYYLLGNLTKEELFVKLETAIFQFAKRQMTWFRKMEKEGVKINWVNKNCDNQEIIKLFNNG